VPSSISSTLNLRALVLSLVAAYLLLALGWRAVQAVVPAPEGTLVEVVRARLADDANGSAADGW
jgi:hypothetical protein